jgi:hypothetical protein
MYLGGGTTVFLLWFGLYEKQLLVALASAGIFPKGKCMSVAYPANNPLIVSPTFNPRDTKSAYENCEKCDQTLWLVLGYSQQIVVEGPNIGSN